MGESAGRRAALEAFRRAAAQEAHNLKRRPEDLWQELFNRLQWKEGCEALERVLAPELERRMSDPPRPWARSLFRTRESEAFVMVLSGHAGPVEFCAFSPDGACIASASDDQTLRLWDAETGEELQGFALAGAGGSAAFCPVSARVCCGDGIGSLYLLEFFGAGWTGPSGAQHAPHPSHEPAPTPRGAAEPDRLQDPALELSEWPDAAVHVVSPSLRTRAQRALASSEFDDALFLAGAALAVDPHCAREWLVRAKALFYLARNEECLEAAEGAMEAGAPKLDVYLIRLSALMYLERWDELLESSEAALAFRAKEPSFLFAKGVGLNGVGRIDEAYEAFKEFLAVQPESGVFEEFHDFAVAYVEQHEQHEGGF